jgi:ComF family protein
MLQKIFQIIIDSLFPTAKEEDRLANFDPQQYYDFAPKAFVSPIQNTSAIFAYQYPLTKQLIWNIKYKKIEKAINIGAYALYKEIQNIYKQNDQKIILIPIPISRRRKNERGFNQCELLCQKILDLNNQSQPKIRLDLASNLLKRKVHQNRQTLKNRANRLSDSKDIFEIDPIALKTFAENHDLSSVNILVIDDVITTGSTIKEALENLKSSGFEIVYGLALAH